MIPYMFLGWFKLLFIAAFHVDAAPTWFMNLVLGGEEFRWLWLTRVLVTHNPFEIRVDKKRKT